MLVQKVTRLLVLASLCLAIAFPGIAQSREAAPDDVTFVAYNLKNYLRMSRKVDGEYHRSHPKPENEIEALIAVLVETDPDILGICEIGTQRDLDDLAARLKKAGGNFPHGQLVVGSDEYRHLAILSRFPIVETDHQTTLKYMIDDLEMSFGRGILDATVEVNPDYRLRLLGLHLKSKRPIPEADQALMRRNEAELLRKHIETILEEDPDVNLLAYGDFNDTRNESTIKAIQGRFGTKRYMRDIQLADDLGYRWTYYWSFADQYSRFDFVFVNNGLYPEVALDRSTIPSPKDWFEASDHRPLVVRIVPVERELPAKD